VPIPILPEFPSPSQKLPVPPIKTIKSERKFGEKAKKPYLREIKETTDTKICKKQDKTE
jgi:hypothetical protein